MSTEKRVNSAGQNEYIKPAIEVIKVENEGILASSAPDFEPGGGHSGW